MENKKILKDKELNKVTGGSEDINTIMKCSSCGYWDTWSGDYTGTTDICPNCNKYTFIGTECGGPHINIT